MAWTDLSGYRVKPALHEEATEGWLWIDGDWESGKPIILRYRIGKGRRRKVHLIARTIDDHFRGWYRGEMEARYGQGAKHLVSDHKYLFVSKHYRDRLGILDQAAGFHGMVLKGLEAKQPGWPSRAWSRLRASLMHADPYVRVGTWIALIGVALAIIALGPVFVRLPQWNPWGL